MDRRHFLTLSTMAGASLHAQESGKPAKIPCAQIGTSHAHASGKMDAVRGLPDLYEVTGIAEPSNLRWKSVSKQKPYLGLPRLSVEQIIAGPSRMVAIETAIDDAPAAATRCLEAGKHIHLDKPGALAHADFKKLRLLAEEKDLIVQMGYMLRYNPAFQLLFKAQREGWLGEITNVDATMGKLASEALRKELGGLPGGGMFELACHLVDAVITLMGKPDEVHAFSSPTRDDGVKDNQLAVFTYPKATATIRCNHTDPFGGPHRAFRVIGTKGSMEISPLESGRGVISLTEACGPYKKGTNSFALDAAGGRYTAEFIDFAAAIRGEKKLAWDAAHDIAVHEAVLKSSGLS